MKLKDILEGVSITSTTADGELEIGAIRNDSRQVQPGDLFVAIRGFAADGHDFIGMALARGAAAVICEEGGVGFPTVLVKNARATLADVAANFYGHPASKLKIIGVTGTNGKTTTTCLLKHILEQQGYKVGLIGTNQNMIGDQVIPTERTTPESVQLHEMFGQMVDAGCTHVVMEVSSHSLVLDRVRGMEFAVGAFTNLTQDHLDFHGTMEEYCKAKALLFQQSACGVINGDDPVAIAMQDAATCPYKTFSLTTDDADVSAKNITLRADGVSFIAAAKGEIARVQLGIPGQFSVANALTALTVCLQLGISLEDAANALRTAQGVKGRVEVVPTPVPTDYTILIDYAHSPDGVDNVLRAVRGFTTGRVIAVFGCGGDRDRTKRPLMGAIAARLADFCMVTSDNPRTEEPNAILQDIVAGMRSSTTPMEVEVDRVKAIHRAMAIAQAGDTIVLMGKGHETYQDVGGVKHHMDEREIVQEAWAPAAQ